ncbi:hypothetical protein MMC21_004054 [Puttea exsequens]|nr:hypothetical protein [Puttea exsequens]
MSKIIANNGRKFIAGGAIVGTYFVWDTVGLGNPFKTHGVENIEKRYSSGGADKNHTPGVSTRRGDPDRQVGPAQSKGIGTPGYEDKVADQRPTNTKGGAGVHAQPESKAGEKANEALYGQTKPR